MCLGIPGKIETIHSASEYERSGKVSFGGISKEVNLSLVPEAGVGDYVIVHVGIAISTIRKEEASKVFKLLKTLG
ncbi:HypC/HybG/HupF family hydrogenase formation chaperone [Microbulbifer sp. OS29]|uniref:HypC/HybG/HupF family hydrogenase formation chaperone n=1 Tax=Microbulbifer okhotskensis TaxID=2926617 RepID=A0A9X2J7T1_9GAMM|nr:HypC/HybG/HupF family hydrogenase formation chaperone [Microbulbifer okhotskensis]MCO1336105.1 HypC/HybG/HupF family hydrogenase formation chaperone [Microbulbifer okhotskensis]